MEASFSTSPTGHLVATVNGAEAFVPNPLPPKIDGGAHIAGIADAAGALGELLGSNRRLANASLLLRPLQQREALTSSAIEGTHSTEENLALLEATSRETASSATLEVANYAAALQDSLRAIVEGASISQHLIRSIHRRLLEGVPDLKPGIRPGEFKSEQNFIGGRAGRIDLARFVPPPPLIAADLMAQLEAYLSQDRSIRPHPLIDAALIHYQFEAIHPFADGNGRVGRILIPLTLESGGVPGARLLYVSPYIEKTKDEYVRLMYEVSRTGDWDSWVSYFLVAVRESANAAVATTDRLIELQDRYAGISRRISQSANLRVLVDLLFQSPVVTVPIVRDRLAVTYRSALKLVEKLVEAGLLSELKGFPVRTFIAFEIVRIARVHSSA